MIIIEGIVEHGKKLGRTIGFPTANLHVSTHHFLQNTVHGVYVYVNNQQYKGMMNIGTRPTFDDGGHTTIEVHILDFNQIIYGERVIIEPVFQIREEKKFTSLEQLTQQLKEDLLYARQVFISQDGDFNHYEKAI